MDRREGLPFSGSSYYMQRGMASSSSGLQGSPTMYPLSGANAPFQSTAGGTSMGSTIPVEPPTMAARAVNIGAPSATPPGEPIRRKRGRPRKYGPDAKVLMPLPSPSSSPATTSPSINKRGRGRPPGTGRKQQIASMGGWLSSSAGIGFTPHVIPISVGEDIAIKILSFSQQSPRTISVLSANGAISTVCLRQPSSSGSTVTYEGRFEILCLSGSYFLTANSGSHNRIGGLSVTLASPDGRVIGGGVGGELIAASPVQVIVGSYTCGSIKGKSKTGRSVESGSVSQHLHIDDSATLESVQPNQNLASSIGMWPPSQQMDVQTSHVDINLMH